MINNVFIHPGGDNLEFVQHTFNEAIGILVRFLSNANKHALLPESVFFADKDFTIPEGPRSAGELSQELEFIVNHSMNAANKGYIGHMDSLPTLYSIIGSLYSAALNNNMFSLEMSPYFTRLEYSLIKQIGAMFGLPDNSTGCIVSGGSLSNIQAIIVARNYFLKSVSGSIEKDKQLVILASEHAHVSIRKAAMVAGIGSENVIAVNADANCRMDAEDLREKIKACLQEGKHPFAVVATAGTTVAGSIDPLTEVGNICREFGLWFHVDAIYGGALVFSDRYKYLLAGCEKADSISFNPQKWLHIAKTCSILLFRDTEILEKYFRTTANYTKAQNEFVNLSELSLQGTKHAEVLKLWLSLLSIGKLGYGKLIEDSIAKSRAFKSKLRQLKFIVFATEEGLNMPTFRICTGELSRENDLNRRYNEFALTKYNLFFSLPTFNGKFWQRVILLNPFIDDKVIESVYQSLVEFANEEKLEVV